MCFVPKHRAFRHEGGRGVARGEARRLLLGASTSLCAGGVLRNRSCPNSGAPSNKAFQALADYRVGSLRLERGAGESHWRTTGGAALPCQAHSRMAVAASSFFPAPPATWSWEGGSQQGRDWRLGAPNGKRA